MFGLFKKKPTEADLREINFRIPRLSQLVSEKVRGWEDCLEQLEALCEKHGIDIKDA